MTHVQQLQSLLKCLANDESIKAKALRNCLKSLSVAERYKSLQNVRGEGRFTEGQTALHGAVRRGYKQSVGTLLDRLTTQQKYDILKVQDRWDITVLHLAAVKDQTDAAKFQLSSLEPEHQLSLLMVRDFKGMTALHWAAKVGQTDTAGVLLSSLVPEEKLSLLKVKDSEGMTALHFSALRGPTDTTRILLSSMASGLQLTLLKLQDNLGMTALHGVAYRGQTDTARVLLSSLKPEQQLTLLKIQDRGVITGLQWPEHAGQTDKAGVQLSSLALLHQPKLQEVQDNNDNKGSTALHHAAAKGQTNTMKVLLSGLRQKHLLTLLKVQNSKGHTALHHAAIEGHPDTAEVLLGSLAPDHRLRLLDIQNKAGCTAEDVAIELGHPDTGAYLQQNRAEAQKAIYRVSVVEDLGARDKGLEVASEQQGNKIEPNTTITEQDRNIREQSGAIGEQDGKVRELKLDLEIINQTLAAEIADLKVMRTQQIALIREQAIRISEGDDKLEEMKAALGDMKRRMGEEIGRLQTQQFQTGELIDGQSDPQQPDNLDEKNLEGGAGNSAISTDELEPDIGTKSKNKETNKDTLKNSPAASPSSINETTLKTSVPNKSDVGTGTVAASSSGSIALEEYVLSYISNMQRTYGPDTHNHIGPVILYLAVFTDLIKIAIAHNILMNKQYFQGMQERSKSKEWKARILLINIAVSLPHNNKVEQVGTTRQALIEGLPQFISGKKLSILRNERYVPTRYLQGLIHVLQNREQLSNFVLQIILESRLNARDVSQEVKYLPDELGLKYLGNEISKVIDQRNIIVHATGYFESVNQRYEFFTNIFTILTEINWKFINSDATQEEIKAKLANLIGENKEVVTMLKEISKYIETVLTNRISLLEQHLKNLNVQFYRHPTDKYAHAKEISETKADNSFSDPEHREGYLTAKRNVWLREHMEDLAKAAKACGIPESEDFSPVVKLSQDLEDKYKHRPSPRTEEEELAFEDEDEGEGEDVRDSEDWIPASSSSFEKLDGAQAEFFRFPTLSSNPSLPMRRELDTKPEISSTRTTNKDTREKREASAEIPTSGISSLGLTLRGGVHVSEPDSTSEETKQLDKPSQQIKGESSAHFRHTPERNVMPTSVPPKPQTEGNDEPFRCQCDKSDHSEADRDSKQTKHQEVFEMLLQKIKEICRSCSEIKMPLLMVAPENHHKLLVQGSHISDETKKELKNLCIGSTFSIVVANVSPDCVTSEGLPIYTKPLGLGPGLGSWPIYKLENGEVVELMGSTGLFVLDMHRPPRLFSVTACHVLQPSIRTDKEPDNAGLLTISKQLTSYFRNIPKLQTKTQNEPEVHAEGQILVSYKYYANNNIGTFNLSTQDWMTDIALIELRYKDIEPWLTQGKDARNSSLERHYGCYSVNESGFTPEEGIIVGVLPITKQQQINRLRRNDVRIFIRGRGDLHGVILDRVPFWLIEEERKLGLNILFTLNSALMPGTSGAAVMVRHKDGDKFYIIGILHGLWKQPLEHSCTEIYIATLLGASLDRLQHIYGGVHSLQHIHENLNPGITSPLRSIWRDRTVAREVVNLDDLARDPSYRSSRKLSGTEMEIDNRRPAVEPEGRRRIQLIAQNTSTEMEIDNRRPAVEPEDMSSISLTII